MDDEHRQDKYAREDVCNDGDDDLVAGSSPIVRPIARASATERTKQSECERETYCATRRDIARSACRTVPVQYAEVVSNPLNRQREGGEATQGGHDGEEQLKSPRGM